MNHFTTGLDSQQLMHRCAGIGAWNEQLILAWCHWRISRLPQNQSAEKSIPQLLEVLVSRNWRCACKEPFPAIRNQTEKKLSQDHSQVERNNHACWRKSSWAGRRFLALHFSSKPQGVKLLLRYYFNNHSLLFGTSRPESIPNYFRHHQNATSSRWKGQQPLNGVQQGSCEKELNFAQENQSERFSPPPLPRDVVPAMHRKLTTQPVKSHLKRAMQRKQHFVYFKISKALVSSKFFGSATVQLF